MKKWILSFLGLDKLFIDVNEIHNETSELTNSQRQLISKTEELNHKLMATNPEQLSKTLISLTTKIDVLLPAKTEFTPYDLAIKDVLGNIVLNFLLKGKEEVDLTRAKKVQGAALFATSAINIAAFQGISQNLFYATANPSTLMAIKGGVGSAVMGAKGIAGQAPFITAGLGAFTPILLFQATSMLIMQSSINNLADRIELVNKKVELLLKYTEKEKEATLITINEKLISLDQQKFYTTEDFVLLEIYKDRLSILSKEYRLLAVEALINLSNKSSELDTSEEEVVGVDVKKKLAEKSLDLLQKMKKSAYQMAERIPHKDVTKFVNEKVFDLFRNSNGNVEKINQAIVSSKLQYFLVLSSTAESLNFQAKFLELKMNYAQINPDNNRIEKAKYLVEKFKKDDPPLSSQNLSLLKDVEEDIVSNIDNLLKNSDWKRENISNVKKEILQSFAETKTLITKNQDEIYFLKNSLINEKPMELVVEYKDGEENIYVLNS